MSNISTHKNISEKPIKQSPNALVNLEKSSDSYSLKNIKDSKREKIFQEEDIYQELDAITTPESNNLSQQLNFLVEKTSSWLHKKIEQMIQNEKKQIKRKQQNFIKVLDTCKASIALFNQHKQFALGAFQNFASLQNNQKEKLSEQFNSEPSFESSIVQNTEVMKKIKQWDSYENEVYLKCLSMYPEQFEQQNRRKSKIFKKLSQMLDNSRTCHQCRGHHKKMIEKYHTIDQIKKVIGFKINSKQSKIPEQKAQTINYKTQPIIRNKICDKQIFQEDQDYIIRHHSQINQISSDLEGFFGF